MGKGFDRDELLEVPEIARYLKVSDVTVYRWCNEGRLPCLKLGRHWRVRRSALEAFLERGEHSATLFGRLRSFYRIPDNVLAIAQTHELLFQLDTAFFGVGEVRGAKLVKFHGPRTGSSIEELRAELEDKGLDVERLEGEGRLRFVPEDHGIPKDAHVEALQRVYEEEEVNGSGHTLWVSFDWTKDVDLEEALEGQRKLTQFAADRQLVVQTGILEDDTDEWPPPLGRRAQVVHLGTAWLSEAGLATNRVEPVAVG
ncbi:MAG: helix-turn-helix domain-containing protein [Actinomycetota bacterium]|nr:helix-turn-helix domain-containing protein [Actinomycetota bacterium]